MSRARDFEHIYVAAETPRSRPGKLPPFLEVAGEGPCRRIPQRLPTRENVSTLDFRIIGQIGYRASPSIATSQVSTHQLPELDAPSALPCPSSQDRRLLPDAPRAPPASTRGRLVGRASPVARRTARTSSALGGRLQSPSAGRRLRGGCRVPRRHPEGSRARSVVDRPRDSASFMATDETGVEVGETDCELDDEICRKAGGAGNLADIAKEEARRSGSTDRRVPRGDRSHIR